MDALGNIKLLYLLKWFLIVTKGFQFKAPKVGTIFDMLPKTIR